MRKTAFFIVCILLFAASAWAEYDIYLKNGSVIKSVGSYKELDGQVMFRYMGGTVAIPKDDIDKIEESRLRDRSIRPEAVRPPAPPTAAPPRPQVAPPPMQIGEGPEVEALKQRLSAIEEKLKEIEEKKGEYNKLIEEYDKVRLRIEVLFQKGVTKAKNQNGDPAKWYDFLTGQERQWTQLNTLKKNKLEKEIKEMEGEVRPLLQQEQALLSEKQSIEARIKELKGPF